jgi:hypothetical protein
LISLLIIIAGLISYKKIITSSPSLIHTPKKLDTSLPAPIAIDKSKAKLTSDKTLTSSKQLKAKNLFTVAENDIPPGFENLLEAQTGQVDVYFQDLYIGTFAASYNLKTIRFLQPTKIIELLSDVKDKPVLLRALADPLAINDNKLCQGNKRYQKASCGLLNPDVIGVIFNRAELRADLFIGPQYSTGAALNKELLPTSTSGFSFASMIAGTVNSASNTFNTNLTTTNVAAFQQFNINANSSYAYNKSDQSENSSLLINNLNANWRFDQYKISAGAITSDGNNFLPGQQILGLSVGTSLDTVSDNSKNVGSPLEVYLALPSTVSIFSDGRLLASQHYPAGRQFLNTTNLPDGAYEVELKIQADNGSQTTQQQFFSKTQNVPPLQFPQYHFQVGAIQAASNSTSTFNHYTDQWLYNIDVNRRVTNILGFEASVTGISNTNFLTLGGFILGSGWQFEPSVLVGDKQQHGIGLSTTYQLPSIYANIFLRKIWAPDTQTTNIDPTTFSSNNSSILNVINGDSNQASASLTYTIHKVSLSLAGNYFQSTQRTSYSYGPSISFPIYSTRDFNINGSSDITRTDNDLQYWLNIRIYINAPNSTWSHYALVGYRGIIKRYTPNSNNSGENLQWQSNWQDLDMSNNGPGVSLGATSQNGVQSANVNVRYQANQGLANFSIRQNHAIDYNGTQYMGNFLTHYIYTPTITTIGGAGSDNTGIIVDVTAPNDEGVFEVSVNRQVRKIIKANTPTFITLLPFEKYQINIAAIGDTYFDVQQANKIVVLHKGNVQSVNWIAQRKIVLITQIVAANGEPLSDVLVKGGPADNLTAANGDYQGEIYSNEKQLLVKMNNNQSCVIDLSTLPKNESIVTIDKLICR